MGTKNLYWSTGLMLSLIFFGMSDARIIIWLLNQGIKLSLILKLSEWDKNLYWSIWFNIICDFFEWNDDCDYKNLIWYLSD